MNRTQNYVSSELTHFVGRSLPNDDERFNLFIEIIKTGKLRTRSDCPPGGSIARVSPHCSISTNEMFNPDMICFCDIPFFDIEIHMNKYSQFGISFKKEFLITKGVRPVLYIPKNVVIRRNTCISDVFDEKIKEIYSLFDRNEIIQFDTSQFLTFQIFSYIKFFDSEIEDIDPENYYMEREWRGLGRIVFDLSDIYRIILPSKFVNAFFKEFPGFNSQVYTV